MPLRCHLFAVEADQIAPMKANPALVLGRGILSGMPSCHLENSAETLQKLLRNGGKDPHDPLGFLQDEGYRLGEDRVTTDSRLLTPKDVRAFHESLQTLSEPELFRRFHRLAILAAGADALQVLEASWEDSRNEKEADALWCGDWTIDQAEEYELLAQDFEKLRAFLAETAAEGRGVAIVSGRGKTCPHELPAEQRSTPSQTGSETA